jgi:DNA-binding LacI/PurR family transcriptional regulator
MIALKKRKVGCMVTIREVAAEAGVSISTVSLVLNKSPLVKEETRQYVQSVIKKMKYVPNNSARGLSSKTTNSLGIVFMAEHSINNREISYDFDQRTGLCSFNISNGIMSGLNDTLYGIVTERFCSVEAPNDLPKIVKSKRVDGVFIVGSPYAPEMIENLKKIKIPFVVVGVDSYENGIDSIYADPGEGTAMAFRLLRETGHENICLISCPKNFHSFYTRAAMVSRVAYETGANFNHDWIIACESNNGKSGYDAFKAFYEQGNRPDGIITADDYIAMGILRYLYEKGIRVPDDVSIVPYDDSSLCGYAAPGLTSINIQRELIGERAAHCLVARIENPDKPIEKISIPPRLVMRESVKQRS